MGQRIISFTIRITDAAGSTIEIKKTTIGHKRIITFPSQHAMAIKIFITNAKASPLISEIDAYRIDELLIEKE